MFYFFKMWGKLGDKDLVVQFQQFCGLRWKTMANHESNGIFHSDLEITKSETKSDKYLQNGGIEKSNIQNSDIEYNSVVHVLFHLSSALGDEQVLIALLSFVLWNIDEKAVIKAYLSLAISLYLGQGAKDTFLAPRPPSPPVIRVEKKYAEEYSTPSTHAMIGLVVPFALVYYTHENFEYNIYFAIFIATIYSSLVAASRVYLGMHYVKDVIYGILFEIVIMMVVLPILKEVQIESWCRISPNILSLAVVCPVMLLYLYPTSTPISYNTYSDTALVLGCAAGALIGLRFSGHNEMLISQFLVKMQQMSTPKLIMFYALRFTVGTVLLALTRIVSKWCVTSSLSKMLPSYRTAKPLNYKRHVEVPHKLITYGLVSFNAIYLAPQFFKYFGLS